MRLSLFFIILLLLTSLSQTTPDSHLGITLMPHYPENLVTYNLVEEREGKITKCQTITERNFLLMAAGEMRCKANPNQINLLEKHNIPLCTITYNQPFRSYSINCKLIDRLWRVRYPYHPKSLKHEKDDASILDNVPDSLRGWASGQMNPSEGQFKLLKKYGIDQSSDVIYGDSLWLFLNDICNANWVNTYKSF